METGVTSLEGRQAAARQRLESLLKLVDSIPKQAEDRPHQYSYNPNHNPNQDTVIASRERNRSGEGPPVSLQTPETQQHQERGRAHGIAPDELIRLAPRLRPYLEGPNPTWPDLVEAADWLRHELGVSKSLWAEACLVMGREMAAVALAIVSTKDPEHFRTTPGGYFHGMVAKAKAGELHLERTVWALRRAAEPERGRYKGHIAHDRHHP
jgi:replication initiation protein RepC